MNQRTRRGFLTDVGRGALVATIGSTAALDLELTPAIADEPDSRLTFGALESLVALMQETPVERLVPEAVKLLRAGTPLQDLVASAAFANARTFGGEDYVGFHTMMALAPAFHMARELPQDRQPLPVLKVLYRNTNRIQEFGGRSHEVLHPIPPLDHLPPEHPGLVLQAAVRSRDMPRAEATFAAIAREGPDEAFNDLLYAVQDNTEVHRTVLPYRAWDLLGLIGLEQAHTLLRQSVRYCVKSEKEWQHTEATDRPRVLLPRLFDQHKLEARSPGSRSVDDAWVDSLANTLFTSTPDQAAEAVAAALAEGIDPSALGEALSLAANQLVLRDAGRPERDVRPGKPVGSVHGDSIGVHACDSANAWRNMAAVSNPRNQFACLILGAYQVALDRVNRGGDFLHWTPHPRPEDLESVRSVTTDALKPELDSAIRSNDQARASALTHRLGESGADPRQVFNLLLRYAISEDGALHAEKYYRTVSEEFASARPSFRWRQLTALARVTASEFGQPAPGHAQAVEQLRL